MKMNRVGPLLRRVDGQVSVSSVETGLMGEWGGAAAAYCEVKAEK